MALEHLGGLRTCRQAEHLVAEADAEQRHVALQQPLDHRHGILARRRRIAGAVRQEHAIGLQPHDLVQRGARRHHRHLRAGLCEIAENIVLRPVIDRDDMRLLVSVLGIAMAQLPGPAAPILQHAARHAGDEVQAFEPAPFRGLLPQGVEIEFAARAVRDHGVGRAVQADTARQRARVHARQADLPMRATPVDEFVAGAEIGMRGDFLPHDAAQRAEAAALVVFLVRADIADMRESEGDDLAVIARIGQHFLIAGHRGVEADLAHRRSRGAEALAPDSGPIRQHEDAGRA